MWESRPRELIGNRPVDRCRWGRTGDGNVGVHVDAEDTARTTKLVIDSAEIDLLDVELAKHGGTHDAGFDGDV